MGQYKQTSVCKICLLEKDRFLFPLHEDGRLWRSMCKECYKPYKYNLAKLARQRRRQCGKKEIVKYRKFKKDFCEKCKFKGLSCQLDVNHKDGNHKNNNFLNLETLCANCHRLVTYKEKHGIYRYENGKLKSEFL